MNIKLCLLSRRVAKKILFSCNKLHFVKVNKPEPICSTWRLEQYPSCLKRLYVKKKIEVQTLSEHWVLFFCWTANEIRRSRIGRVNGWPAGVSHCRPAYVPYLSLSHCDKSLTWSYISIILLLCGGREESNLPIKISDMLIYKI